MPTREEFVSRMVLRLRGNFAATTDVQTKVRMKGFCTTHGALRRNDAATMDAPKKPKRGSSRHSVPI